MTTSAPPLTPKPRLLIEALYSYADDREDRLTEVLAAVLEVHEPFCHRFAARLGVRSEPAGFTVRTQFGPPGQRRLIDLLLQGLDAEGKPLVTVFVENKYNPTAKLEPYWFTEDQADRQRNYLLGLREEAVLAGIASKQDLERLDGPEQARLMFDPRDAYDCVISWTDVKDLARQVATAGPAPEYGRSSDAPCAERLLLEFLAYLELEGDVMGALGNDDLFALERILITQERIDGLLYGATKKLGEQMAPLGEEGEFGFEQDEESSVEDGISYLSDAPKGSWLEELRDSQVYVMVAQDEAHEDEGTFAVYAGLAWYAGREGKKRITGSRWESQAKDSLLDIYWDNYNASIAAARPLRDIVEGGSTISQQSELLADWAYQIILAALRLPPPPRADDEESGDQAA